MTAPTFANGTGRSPLAGAGLGRGAAALGLGAFADAVAAPSRPVPAPSRAKAARPKQRRSVEASWRTTLAEPLLPWLLPLALLALWLTGAAQGWIAPQVLPPPQFVWETLRALAGSGDLWLHVSASLQRVLVGFAIGALLGLALGSAMGLSRSVEAYVLPGFNALVQIPVLGWLPFVLLLVGIGEPLKYILIAKAALVPVALNTLQGFRQTPQSLFEVGAVYGYTRRQQVLEIVLPHAAPTLFTGLRLGFTKAWLSLVVVELVASSEGLGYLIVYGRQLFQLDQVMAAVIVVGAIGYAIDRALDKAERRVVQGGAR